MQCRIIVYTNNNSANIAIAVSETDEINLLSGNNSCSSCIEIECHGGLNVAISSPDPSQLDIVCPVYSLSNESDCFSPDQCPGFNSTPFFQICEASPDSKSSKCRYSLCFDNVNKNLNYSRVDLFVYERTVCESTFTLYYARKYIKSYEIKGWYS